ncbi:MAG: WYL domain-containing protein, partial [Silvibacterium sp.]
LRDRIDQVQLYAPGFRVSKELRHRLDSLHHAAIDRSVLDVEYSSEAGDLTRRRIRPLALVFWGGVWTLVGWCELRRDFRSFRVDRMQFISILDEIFTPQAGQTLADFLKQVRAQSPDQTGR